MIVLSICVLVISICIFYMVVKKIKHGRAPRFKTTIPGLQPSDVLEGNLPDVAEHGSLHGFLQAMHGRYGDIFSFWFRKQFMVSIASPRLFKEYASSSWRPVILFDMYEPMIGPDSIQFCNSDELALRHGAYGRCFSDSANAKYYKMVDQCTRELVGVWEALPSGEHVSLQPAMFTLSIRNMFLCAYDKRLDDSTVNRLQLAYDKMFEKMESWFLPKNDDVEKENAQKEEFAKHKAFVYGLLRELLEARTSAAPSEEPLLSDVILSLGTSDSTRMSDAVTVTVAGIHTTGFMMMWTLYFLACDQKIQDRLHEEITRVIGPGEKVTPENIDRLVYLRQVLKEALRRQSVGPYAARFQNTDCTLGGHHVPAGTPVIQALGVALGDKTIYPEPEKFDPDRFAPDRERSLPPYGFEPFGFGGMRRCLGWRFAYVEATVVLATLLRRFRVRIVAGQDVTPVYGMTSKPTEDAWVTVEKRAVDDDDAPVRVA